MPRAKTHFVKSKFHERAFRLDKRDKRRPIPAPRRGLVNSRGSSCVRVCNFCLPASTPSPIWRANVAKIRPPRAARTVRYAKLASEGPPECTAPRHGESQGARAL